MKIKKQSLMQSEIFVILMIIIILLYVLTSNYASKLEKKIIIYKDMNKTFIAVKTKSKETIKALENITNKLARENNITKAQINVLLRNEQNTLSVKKKLTDLTNDYTTLQSLNLTHIHKIKELNEMINMLKKKWKPVERTKKDLELQITIKKKNIYDLKELLKDKNRDIVSIKHKLNALLEKYNDLTEREKTYLSKINELRGKYEDPPLITLSEEKGFLFPSGKATLTPKYRNKLLTEIMYEILENIKKYDCDVIEIYGYTDTQQFGKRGYYSNSIDNKLHECLRNGCDIDTIKTYTNLELGMKRAIAVVSFLKQQWQLANVTIRPFSAGQFLDERGHISTLNVQDTKKRRRIEIRLSKSQNNN